jgi:hypothetical protein
MGCIRLPLTSPTAAGKSNKSQSFTYDVYGNLNCPPSGPRCVGFSYSSTNRNNASCCDHAGNVTNTARTATTGMPRRT